MSATAEPTFPPWRICSFEGCTASTRSTYCPRHRELEPELTPGTYLVVSCHGSSDLAVLVDGRTTSPGFRWCLRWCRGARRFQRKPALAKYLGVATARDVARAGISRAELVAVTRVHHLHPRLFTAGGAP